MKLFRFDEDAGKSITAYNSSNLIMSKILFNEEGTLIYHVGCMHIGAGGSVGRHPASTDQLFLVVSGEGWVQAMENPPVPISSGYAAFWEQGEWHESGSESGMTVIVIEGNGIKPNMPEV
ncbi:cupin domain-containing protein [Paenibacillus marinisediminis]